jgi:hypothetical protein
VKADGFKAFSSTIQKQQNHESKTTSISTLSAGRGADCRVHRQRAPVITAIAAGGGQDITGNVLGGHSLFIKSDGSLWAMGNNQYGQLGDGTTQNQNRPEMIEASGVTAIAAGQYHSLFIMNDSLWAMGNNQ